MTPRRSIRGFTLFELAIVLVIIAIVTGMAVTTGVSIVATARLTATQHKMKAIEDALLAYRSANDRIPCPADLTMKEGSGGYGIEAAVPGTCTGSAPAANFTSGTTAEGGVPAVTLGLPADFMVDGWGNRFRYAVDTAMTKAGIFSATPLGANCGPLTVNDASGNARSSHAMYALISHGANGHGAYTRSGATVNAGSTNANELINCHCDSTGAAATYSPAYVQMSRTQDPANALNSFDDIVAYKERWQLRTDWDKAGGSCTAIYVTDYSNNRVQKFDGNGNFVLAFGSAGSGNGQFQNPRGITVDKSGNVWVVDLANYRVQEFDSNGNYLNQIAGGGWGPNNLLQYPKSVLVDRSGNIWITDDNGEVREYNSGGNVILTIGSFGTGNGQLEYPEGFVFDGSGNIWVTDPFASDRVEEFSSTGSYLNQFGGPPGGGSGDGQLYLPQGIAIDGSGNFWVVDSDNHRIEEFSSTGSFVKKFGSYGSGDGQFNYPENIAFDGSGNIWVTDTQNNRVQEFDSNGNYIKQFGSSGSGNGQFSWAWGIAISR